MITQKLLRYYHTMRFLRPVQIYGRVVKKFSPASPDLSPAPARRQATGMWAAPPGRTPSLLGPHTVSFLNQTRDIDASTWTDPQFEKLWLLNLHYFDDLNAEEAEKRLDWHQGLIQRWIAENPPAVGIGWEAYPISLRLVNWIKWELAGHALSDAAVQSLAAQARYLAKTTEWYLLGNHLLANAKGLIYAGLFFAGPEAEGWLAQGLALWQKELREEILGDGGHFERSPMYHSIILEDLLDLQNAARLYPNAIPERWRAGVAAWPETIEKMRRWLQAMCHPDGEISFFNDAALGIAPPSAELEEYAARLGFAPLPELTDGITHLRDSGYVRWQRGPAVCLLDVGEIGPSYIPGHSHADTLSFEMSLFGQRVIVNSGTSTYNTFPQRQRERGTAAHSTVIVDDADSSEVWGAFRVARRAHPQALSVSSANQPEWAVTCAQDGYRRLPGRVTHRRTWRLTDQSLVVEDVVEGQCQTAAARFHLHPSVTVAAQNFSVGNYAISWSSTAAGTTLEPDEYHPHFGVSLPSQCLVSPVQKSAVVTFSWP